MLVCFVNEVWCRLEFDDLVGLFYVLGYGVWLFIVVGVMDGVV